MKRVLIVLGILLLVVSGLSAQIDYNVFGDAFEDFASEISTTLPSTAAVAGLNWSPAYIGAFPHFGVGISLGAFTIPYDFVEPLITDLGLTLPSEFDYVKKWGMPMPAVALDARIGGFILPFDVGLKFGYIPDKLRDNMGKVNADYLLAGGDVRMRLLEGSGLRPTLSVGGGYTFLEGSIGIPDFAGTTIINLPPPLDADFIEITSPELTFALKTSTFVGKVQASWNLAILTPHLGIGAAYGLSTAGGGLSSDVLYNGVSPMTPSEIQQIIDAFASYGYSIDELDNTGIKISSDADGFSFWVYGGTAINIFFIKVDLSAMYNLLSKSYGGALNVRFQL
ncbi:MAG: hypothetical protein JSV89_02270 [Spirochaetaceae bacterium]|nr:MAG: hypothetical protein JSV89_02270 [Spirochaetaceae bacterium]